MTSLVLLGPQRFDPTVGEVVQSPRVSGPIATITAGWQEREADDAELDALLDGRSRNLGLYTRWRDVLQRDPDLAAADGRRRERLDELQAAYLLRLHHAIEAVYEVQRRVRDPEVADAEVEDAIATVRSLDARHRARLEEVNAAFVTEWRPGDRPGVAAHRRAVTEILRTCAAVAIAGGHVAVLLRCLWMLDVASALMDRPVVAWSAGAMATCDTVVLFHDLAVHGPGHAEVYDRGLGLCHGIVALPHARRRLQVDDQRRMAVLARRFAPAHCMILEDGTRIDCHDGRCDTAGSTAVDHDGKLATMAA